MPRGETRKGNGAGYGGPARGDAKPVNKGGRTPGVALVDTKAAIKRETFRAVLEAHTADLPAKWLAIAQDPAHPHQHTMILKAAEIAGEFKHALEVTGADGGPLEIVRRIVDPATD